MHFGAKCAGESSKNIKVSSFKNNVNIRKKEALK